MTTLDRTPVDHIRNLTAFVAAIREQMPATTVRATATTVGAAQVTRTVHTSNAYNPTRGEETKPVAVQPMPRDRSLDDTTSVLGPYGVDQKLARHADEDPPLYAELWAAFTARRQATPASAADPSEVDR